MRELNAERYVVEIRDQACGTVHEMYYRMPVTSERASYQASLLARKGNKVVNRVFQTRVDFGCRILTGFRKGSFSIAGKAISADAGDPDYVENWKELLGQSCPEIPALVAQAAFEGVQLVSSKNELEFVEEELDVPLERS